MIGGGIAGLAAAKKLADCGCDVEVLEADEHLGGQVRTTDFCGHRIDVGAEALHRGAPPVATLIDELGLTGQCVEARPGAAWIWTARGLRPLPAGVGPGGPTRLGPVLRARVLSPLGVARAAVEPLVPRTSITPDIGVGAYLRTRFGRQVCERLVDPVLGSLHAGDVDRISLHAAVPQLAARAAQHRSLLLAQRSAKAVGAPSFATFPGGLSSMIEALQTHPSITVQTSTRVSAIEPRSEGFAVTHGTTIDHVDGVVLAVPARVARRLLAPVVPVAAAALHELDAVSVATVLAAYPRRAVADAPRFHGTGILVPSKPARMLKAATYLSRKWAHLDGAEYEFVRLSAGRAGGPDVTDFDDEELVAALHADLAAATGLPTGPVHTSVVRWPAAMARLDIDHLARLARARAALDAHPGLALAGAPYDGLGIAACIASGRRAADSILDHHRTDEVLSR